MTDPFNATHEEAADPQREDLIVHAAPRRVSGLRRQTIRLAIALLAVIVAAALIIGLGIDFHPHSAADPHKIEPPPENLQPSPIADLPSSYADVVRQKSAAPSPMPATMHDMNHHSEATPGTSTGDKEDLARLMSSIQQIGRKNQELAQQLAAFQSAAAEQQAKVWGSSLFFKIDQAPDRQATERAKDAPKAAEAMDAVAALKNAAGAAASGALPAPAVTPPKSPTDQQHKLSFLNESPAPNMDADQFSQAHDSGRGTPDGYLLQTGAVIPVALLTGINTDLPGDVVASVTEGVYDSPTGNHLLIPQGTRLYGSYDSQIAASQDRALLVWHRLLLPDGRSVNLDRMRGTDAAGYAGVADRVDYHADKLATAAVLSGVIAYGGNLAGGRQQTLTLTPGDVVGSAIAQQASNTGSSIVQRQLNVQPTITIRAGWPVRVLVNRDILLPAYAN